jgi:hypothetical protein
LCIFGSSSCDFEIPWLTSNNAHNSIRNFQNGHNPTRNSQIYTIPRGTSKNAQNHRWNFQICTKSHDDLPKMQNIFIWRLCTEETYNIVWHLIFGSPCQRQSEFLSSLGVRRRLTFHILIFSSETPRGILPSRIQLHFSVIVYSPKPGRGIQLH